MSEDISEDQFMKGTIIKNYVLDTLLGKGSYGKVFKAKHIITGDLVAIKIYEDAFTSAQSERFFCRLLLDTKYIVKYIEHIITETIFCIVYELLNSSLHEMVKTKSKGLSLLHIQRLSKNLLEALISLEEDKIVHCDLKPENILFSRTPKCCFKIIDFNMACFVGEKAFTYIQSRYYRAPEILLGLEFDTRIDMWSLGCILIEAYTSKVLFPGKDSSQMLHMIDKLIGDLPHKMVLDGQYSERYLSTSFELPPIKLDDFFKLKDERCLEFEDFVKQLLSIDPKKRPLASQAITHPFITKILQVESTIKSTIESTVKESLKRKTIE